MTELLISLGSLVLGGLFTWGIQKSRSALPPEVAAALPLIYSLLDLRLLKIPANVEAIVRTAVSQADPTVPPGLAEQAVKAALDRYSVRAASANGAK